ncbi:wax ester/triacylglycerol synthase domain-containing protein [Streptomyces longisporoflavus]|uniref:wax ester/triacylglycerol synthase domain-containing protein n=1 Tax=Streptomyces longisporoflavus TaxID=28044 RepID=UPI00167E8907|nr:wax ester/triacylglycerol synthase domain-containing protein [Streptomyces longisporoflavus]
MGEPPSLADLCARVHERWGGIPLMRRTLLRPGQPSWLRRHRWQQTEDIDLRAHVAEACAAVPHDGTGADAFTGLLARLVAQPVPDGRPPWRLLLVRPAGDQGPQGRFALILTAHHALMDGRSLERLLSGLLDGGTAHDGSAQGGVRSARTPRAAVPPARGVSGKQTEGAGRPFEALRSGRALPFPSGPPRPERDFVWTGLDTDTVRGARRALPGLGATLNELVLAASAGALRAVHGTPERWPGAARPLYGMFSVDLRTPEQGEELGNLLSVVRLPLPVQLVGPGERLRACRDLLRGPGPAHDADASMRLVEAASRMGPWALRLLIKRAGSPSWAPVTCTVIRWPRGPWSLDGALLERVLPLAPMLTPGAVRVALTDYARVFTLCVTGDLPGGHARELADAFGRELAALAHSVPEFSARHSDRPS